MVIRAILKGPKIMMMVNKRLLKRKSLTISVWRPFFAVRTAECGVESVRHDISKSTLGTPSTGHFKALLYLNISKLNRDIVAKVLAVNFFHCSTTSLETKRRALNK